MTEVAVLCGGFWEMAMGFAGVLREFCDKRREPGAASLNERSLAKKSGAKRREPVTRLPGSGKRFTGEHFTRSAPQPGAVQVDLLDASVVRTPFGGEIGQKIIGRSFARGGRTRRVRGRRWRVHFALALLHQPARQHGGAIFFNHLIQQGNRFLAQIGDVSEPRQFVALQRIARRRQQKLPRRLNAETGHGASFVRSVMLRHSNAGVTAVKD